MFHWIEGQSGVNVGFMDGGLVCEIQNKFTQEITMAPIISSPSSPCSSYNTIIIYYHFIIVYVTYITSDT